MNETNIDVVCSAVSDRVRVHIFIVINFTHIAQQMLFNWAGQRRQPGQQLKA